MGVNFHLKRIKKIENLEDVLYEIRLERYQCISYYLKNEWYRNRCDQDYYLIKFCPTLNDLYIKADILKKTL